MTVIVFGALVWKVIDFLRMLFNFTSQKSAIITQVTAWVGGVALVVIAAHASVSSSLVLPGADESLKTIDFASQILLGLLISSFASTVVDLKQAFDSTDTATKPSILGTITGTITSPTSSDATQNPDAYKSV
jgi:hypothetical protein